MGGGAIFNFSQKKLASKAPKTCDFAYFTSQLARAPPPPWLRYWCQLSAALEAIDFGSGRAKKKQTKNLIAIYSFPACCLVI